MRTVPCPNNGDFIHPTFHDAARARGFITGDEEYSICMEEASNFQVGSELRALFVTLILDGAPAPKLWSEFKESLIEDLKITRNVEEAIHEALCEIDLKLQMHGKSNTQVNLPAVGHSSTELQRMRKAFNLAECTAYADLHAPNLTSEQRQVYSTVTNSVRNKDGKAYIIDARAGTGKTYTQKCIAARLRGESKVVLIVASTGIAALQLPGGWTAHSMFKLPMEERLTPSCVCNINTQTQRADLIRKADLIIWDELPMTHRYCVEALDRSLRDITKHNKLFGGKTILFSGDWRQIGPISKGDTQRKWLTAPSFPAPYGNTLTGFASLNPNATKKILNTLHSYKISERTKSLLLPWLTARRLSLSITTRTQIRTNTFNYRVRQISTNSLTSFILTLLKTPVFGTIARYSRQQMQPLISLTSPSHLADQDNRCLFSAQILFFRMNPTQTRRSQHLNTFIIFMFQASPRTNLNFNQTH